MCPWGWVWRWCEEPQKQAARVPNVPERGAPAPALQNVLATPAPQPILDRRVLRAGARGLGRLLHRPPLLDGC